jgi:hypothetical protein
MPAALQGQSMRTFILAFLVTFIAAPVYAQTLGTGIPLNQEKEVSPEQAEKRRKTEEAYKGVPDAKPVDPWGNMRSTETAGSGAKTKTAPKKTN